MNDYELVFDDWITNGGLYIIFYNEILMAQAFFNYLVARIEVSNFCSDYKIVRSRCEISNSNNKIIFVKPTRESVLQLKGIHGEERIVFHIFQETKFAEEIINTFFEYKMISSEKVKLIIE